MLNSCNLLLKRLLSALGALGLLATSPVAAQSLIPPGAPVVAARHQTLDGEPAELTTIADLTVDRAGRIYVLESAQQRIAVFNAQGKFVRNLGRKGQGPGEFEAAQSLAILRDTLWVLDVRLDRLTGFSLTANGRPRTLSIQKNVAEQKIGARVSDGILVLRPRRSSSSDGTTAFDILHARDEGVVADSITTLRRMPQAVLRYALYRGGDVRSTIAGQVNTAQPFNDSPIWAVDADGNSIAALERAAATHGTQAHVLLTRTSVRGRVLAKRELWYGPKPVSASAIQRIVDSLAKPIRLPNGLTVSGNAQAIRAALYVPPVHAPVSDFKSGLDGTLWLRLQTPVDAQVEWVQLSADGVPLRRVVLPKNFQMLRATAREVWGWRRDADGVPIVEAYRFQN